MLRLLGHFPLGLTYAFEFSRVNIKVDGVTCVSRMQQKSLIVDI